MFSQIPCYVWGNCQIIQKHIEDGKIKCKNFDSPILAENYLELMENYVSSTGMFPGTYLSGDSPEDPERSASKH